MRLETKSCKDGGCRSNLVSSRFTERNKKDWLVLVFALALVVFLLTSYLFPLLIEGNGLNSSTSSYATPSNVQPLTQGVLATTSGPSAVITVVEQISSHYSLFDLSVREHVIGNMTISSLNLNSSLTLAMLTSFQPSNIGVSDTLYNGTIFHPHISIQKGVYASFVSYVFTLPNTSSSVLMTIDGNQGGEGFVYRQVGTVPVLSVRGLTNISTTHRTFIAVPPHSLIEKAYTYGGPGGPGGYPVSVQKTGLSGGGYDYYVLPPSANTFIVQSIYYFPASVAILVLSVLAVILTLLGFVTTIGKKFADWSTLSRGFIESKFFRPLSSTFHFRSSKAGRNAFSSVGWKRFFRKYLQSKNLLVLFILCGVLMAGLASAAGPAPQFKAYVIADPPVASHIQTELQHNIVGNLQVYTPAQDYVDFQVMSNVGMFNMVVISSFSNFSIADVAQYVTPGLGNVPLIVIDNNANQTFANEIRLAYPQNVINVQNAASLNLTEINQIKSHITCCAKSSPNVLGLQISNRDFTDILAIEGALSMVLVYLGWAFLAAKAVEPTTEDTLTHMVLIIAFGIFVFFFSEMIYVVTSTILRFPLSLHAVISGAKDITATAILGKVIHLPFGGGSTPRDLAAVLGIFVGALGNAWESKFSKKSLVFFIGLGLIIYLNPLVIGQYFYQFLLLFVGNVYLGPVTNNVYSFKDFLYSIGYAFGGNITPVYLLSAGKMAFFAGLVPLAFIRRMGKNTATLTLVVAAIVLGHGGLRVGEMTPDKTVIAVLPGLAAGVVFGLVLLLIAAFEKYLSTHYRRV